MRAGADVQNFSAFIFELYERSEVEDPMTLLKWSVERLGETIDSDSNWGGWAEITENDIGVFASVSRNLPDDYHRFWTEIRHEDLLARDVLATGNEIATYNRQGSRHTDGMVALSDRYSIDKLSVIVVDFKNTPTPLFLSSYRSGRNARALDTAELHYLRAALEHVKFAVERNSLCQRGDHDLLVNEGGHVLAASPQAMRALREAWPGWRGDRLPDRLGTGGERGIRFERRPAPSFNGPPLLYMRICGSDPCSQLTSREREIVQRIADGLTHKEIARSLGISPATARNHTQAILTKVGVRSKAALIKLVLERPTA